MRVVLNTRSDDAGTAAAIHALGARLRGHGVEAVVNDWSGYAGYDVAVFMAYDHELERARAEQPGIRVALADPKLGSADLVRDAARADVLIVSSVEQRDAFLRVNRNAVVWSMFPLVDAEEREHRAKEPVVIGYHGNRVHLEAMARGLKQALEELGRRRAVELHAIYDLERLGRARIGVPDGRAIFVRHVQWTPRYADALREVDIGIVPNELPVRDRLDVLERAAYPDGELAYEPFDHLLRFKVSTNAGRVYPFARLGIPVVADFAPSAAQLVEDGVSGFLASSAAGWYEALEALVDSPELRARLAGELRRRADERGRRDLEELVARLRAPLLPSLVPTPDWDAVEPALERLGRYPRPAGGPLVRRALARLRRR